MAKVGVSLKVNLDAIDASRVFKGQKGSYLDMTVFVDLDQADEYGNNGMITQNVTKEEKEQGVKGAILGNCKVFWSEDGQTQQQPTQQGWGTSQSSGWGDQWAGLKPAGKAAHLTIEQIKEDPNVQGNAQAALNFGWVTK